MPPLLDHHSKVGKKAGKQDRDMEMLNCGSLGQLQSLWSGYQRFSPVVSGYQQSSSPNTNQQRQHNAVETARPLVSRNGQGWICCLASLNEEKIRKDARTTNPRLASYASALSLSVQSCSSSPNVTCPLMGLASEKYHMCLLQLHQTTQWEISTSADRSKQRTFKRRKLMAAAQLRKWSTSYRRGKYKSKKCEDLVL